MTTFTVTATQGGASSGPMAMMLKVIIGQAITQPGATAHALQATPSLAITPGNTGSWVYGAALTSSAVLSPLANTTNEQYSSNAGLGFISMRSTSSPASGSPVTYGEGGTTHGIGIALCEIVAATTLAEDASSPAGVTAANVLTQTTASFTPPPGSLLVLMVATNGGVGTTTMAITDTSGLGLTWTEQSKANGSSSGYAGVWTTQLFTFSQPVAPQPVPPGHVSPASVFFTWRPKLQGATNITSSFTGAIAGPAGHGVNGVFTGPELLFHPEVPAPVFRPISFASPAPAVPFEAEVAAAGGVAATTSRQDPATGRIGVSGVMAGKKTANGGMSGPVAVTGLANGFNLGAGGVSAPAAASGSFGGSKISVSAFTGAAGAVSEVSGGPPVNSTFRCPVAVTGRMRGSKPFKVTLFSAEAPFSRWSPGRPYG